MIKKEILNEIKKGILDQLYDREREYDYIQVESTDITIEELFEEKTSNLEEGYVLTDLFCALQGVTVGGEGSTAIFSNVEGNVDTNNDLIFKTIGGSNINANEIIWTNEYMIFPYVINDDKFVPAFYDNELKEDTLNFDINLDASEVGRDRQHKLTYRIAKGYIKYPTVAEYLCKFYDDLYYREFEGKSILDYNKSWYEFHRPRTPAILSVPKIVFRRLMKEPSFAIDKEGYLPKDSVISLVPKDKFNILIEDLTEITEDEISTLNGYYYILSFLNSEMFAGLLKQKRAKKKGDYPIVGDTMLQNVIIPFPSSITEEELISRIYIS
jgi:hypothetical protein